MNCHILPSPPGTTVIVCTRGRRAGPCVACGRAGTFQCDGRAPAARGGAKLCSAWLCGAHARELGPGVHWCPACLGRPTALVAYTARIGAYRGADALDVTAKSGAGDGLAFAPAWPILSPVLAARRRVKALAAELAAAEHPEEAHAAALALEAAEADAEALWEPYVEAFTAQMRESHGRPRSLPWRRLLALDRVVLLCYCTDPQRCHRTILARDILPRCGAIYGGERPAPSARAEPPAQGRRVG